MNNPNPDFSSMARRLAEALHLPDWDDLNDAELEQLLEGTETEAISELQHDFILTQAQQLIQQWEDSTMAERSSEYHSPNADRQSVVASSSPSASRARTRSRTNRSGSGSAVIMAGLALLAMAVLVFQSLRDRPAPADKESNIVVAEVHYLPPGALRPSNQLGQLPPEQVQVGSIIETAARERRRVTLPDGSILYLNELTKATVKTFRQLVVQTGEVFIEVVPHHLVESNSPFVVETPQRTVTALGTKFLVKANKSETDVLVTQGKVKVSDLPEPLTAGQELKQAERQSAPRASEALLWMKELMAKAESPLIPKSEHAGGALVAIDPSGQEMSLSLRKQHIDVHIEDGFARTTIDQTYFNASYSQMEGTFYFPLPADASLSRLAMYVGENLMEGGMAERDHARNVFEQIRYTRRDPALLEWVDGSTFKMRVFPLEARQEKRIIISYTQRLQSAYGKTHYRFPAGHSLELIRDWSTQILVKNQGERKWASPSHDLTAKSEDGDLLLTVASRRVVDDRDLVVELEEPAPEESQVGVRFSQFVQDGQRYLMLRYRPDLQGDLKRAPRNWVFLFESGGNRDALLARVQIDVLHTLLKNAEHSDTFSIVTAATRPEAWKESPIPCTPQNVEAAIQHLNQVHLVGALDLEKALTACQPLVEAKVNPGSENYLVHLGAGVAVLGQTETDDLLRKLPANAKYIGVGVGKRWSQGFMKAAANRTGGHVTQINPDEEISWRSLELLSLLNAPRVLNVKVKSDPAGSRFLQFGETLAQGEELCAITRLGKKQPLPKSVTITGKLAGEDYRKEIPVENIADNAGYLPRTWARLEIDRLLTEGAEQHKPAIIELSKAMYVMSPFTSLLVLENDEMYAQFNVDRGRKDHWALYPCPPKIPVVYEPGNQPIQPLVTAKSRANTSEDLLKTVLIKTPPFQYRWSNGLTTIVQGVNALQLYTGAIAQPNLNNHYLNYWAMPQSGPGMNLGWAGSRIRFDSGVMPPNGPSVVYPYYGKLMMNSYMGNTYWDDNTDGANFVPSFHRIPIDYDFNVQDPVPEDWYRPDLFGTTVLGGEGWIPVTNFSSSTVRVINLPSDDSGLVNLIAATDRWGTYETRGFYREFIPQNVSGPNARDFLPAGSTTVWLSDFSRPVTFTANSDFRLLGGGQPALWKFGPDGQMVAGPGPGRFVFEVTPTPMFDWPVEFDLPVNGTVNAPILPFGRYDQAPAFGEMPYVTGKSWSIGRFGDLLSFAPGLNTNSLDLKCLMESQGPKNLLPKRGKIDAKAQALIDRARQGGWEQVSLPHGKNQKAFTIRHDAQGRAVYQHTLSTGLKEQVINDGQSLMHMYADLGLGSRRTLSRFHRLELARLIPWLVPPAEDLAVGCNVKSVGDNGVAVVPIPEDTADKTAQAPANYLLMVFRTDGTLQERQIVEAKTNKPLLTIRYAPDGVVEVFDKSNKSLGRASWMRQATDEPNLKADQKDLVLLDLPFRSVDSYLSQEQQQLANNSQFLALDEASAEALLGSYAASGNLSQLTSLIQQRYFAKEDYRLGLYALLASVSQHSGNGNLAGQLLEKHPNSMLAKYLNHHFQWVNDGNTDRELDASSLKSGPIQDLALARNLYQRWSTGKAVANRSAEDLQQARDRDLASIQSLRSSELGWLLLTTMKSADTDPKGLPAYIKLADVLANRPNKSLAARYQAAFWRSEAGETEAAVEQLEMLSQEMLKAGQLPPIIEDTRTAFINHSGLKAWERYLDNLQSKLLQDNQRAAALSVAIRAEQLKKDRLSDRLLTAAMENLKPEQHPQAALLAVGYFLRQQKPADAERFIAPLLKAKAWADDPSLWRKASEIAGQNQQETLSLARLERALDLEYTHLPELINLQAIRTDYLTVLNRIEALAGQQAPEKDLLPRTIRLADRWRVLDPDETAACQAAARILSRLGQEELAWDYLTTPLADKPNESGPWVSLAQTLAGQQKIDQADNAYRLAFKAESTNAEILWNHAEFLRQNDRQEEAQELYEKLASQEWQPRFATYKTQAQQRLNEITMPPSNQPK